MPSVFEIEKLSVVTALRFNNEFPSGANKPILITGVDNENGEERECVVKLKSSERFRGRKEAASFELLATFIAWELNIAVVEPVLVNIIPEFVEVHRGKYIYKSLNDSLGLNYGSIYIPGPVTLANKQNLKKEKFIQAQKIMTFDILVENRDRTELKPNHMVDKNNLIIYDHELAFGFVYIILGTQNSQSDSEEPWLISEHDIQNWIHKMFLYPIVKSKPFPEEEINESLNKINDDFWQKAFNLIPEEWQTDHLERIKNRINLVVNHKQQFVENIKRAVQ